MQRLERAAIAVGTSIRVHPAQQLLRAGLSEKFEAVSTAKIMVLRQEFRRLPL